MRLAWRWGDREFISVQHLVHADKCSACFNATTGDVEDAPALDPLPTFEIVEKNGGVYIKGDEASIKASRRSLNTACSANGQEKVVVVGGYVIAHTSYSKELISIVPSGEVEPSVQSKLCESKASRAASLSSHPSHTFLSTALNFPKLSSQTPPRSSYGRSPGSMSRASQLH